MVRRYASLRFKWETSTSKFEVNARDLQAMISASITNRAGIVELVDQPTTRRGWKFITTPGRGRPSAGPDARSFALATVHVRRMSPRPGLLELPNRSGHLSEEPAESGSHVELLVFWVIARIIRLWLRRYK